MKVLNIHEHDPEVGILGCEALKRILISNCNSTFNRHKITLICNVDETIDKSMEEEAFGITTKILDNNIDNHDLCRIGCDTLKSITINGK